MGLIHSKKFQKVLPFRKWTAAQALYKVQALKARLKANGYENTKEKSYVNRVACQMPHAPTYLVF